MGFYIFESVSENQRGETVCTGVWTNIVRGESARGGSAGAEPRGG
jgi:hypothetical protein